MFDLVRKIAYIIVGSGRNYLLPKSLFFDKILSRVETTKGVSSETIKATFGIFSTISFVAFLFNRGVKKKKKNGVKNDKKR